MRQKHLKRTYKALYMLQVIESGCEGRAIIGHSKITHIDDEVIEAAGKTYTRESIGKPIVIRNDVDGVVLKIPFLCDNPKGAPVPVAVEYIRDNASLNIACHHLFDKCKMTIVNVMGDDDLAGFKLLASAISSIEGCSLEDAKVSMDISDFCNECNISLESMSKYFDRQLSRDNIFNWNLKYSAEGRRSESHQIVTDAKYENGKVELCFNTHLLIDLRRYAKLYESQLDSIKACECSYEQYLSFQE